MNARPLSTWIFAALLALATALTSRAVDPEPYTVPIGFSFKIAGLCNGTMTVYGEGGASAVWVSTASGPTESDPQSARLRPGQAYVLNFQVADATSYWLSLVAPSGYQFFVDGVPRDLIAATPGGGTHNLDYTIEIRPVTGAGFLDAGVFTGIELGQAVSWELGAGGLRSGHSVGRVGFRELDLSSSPASRDRLFYVPPINTWQINLVCDGASNQTIRQIASPRKILDFVDDGSGGYWVKYYDYDDAAQPYTGGVYVFDGSDVPWRTIHVESPASNQLKITETEGSAVRVSHLSLTSGTVASGTYAWQLQEGNATTWLRTTTHASTASSGTRENLVTVRTGGTTGTIVAQTKYVYHTYGWGEDLYQVIVNPNGGSQALTTTYAYYETAPSSGSETHRGDYRRVKSVTGPTGAWTAYEYYDDWNQRGQLKYQYQPYLDSPSSVSLNATLGRVQYFEYSADPTGRYRRPSLVQEKIGNVSVGKTVWTYDDTADTGPLRVKADVDTYRDSSSYVRTHTEKIDFLSGDIDQSGEPCVVKNPDLSQTSWSRSGGAYNPSTHAFTANGVDFYWRELKVHGSTSSSGAESQSSYDSQNFPTTFLVANKSTLEIAIRDVAGYVLRTETRVYTGSGSWSAPLNSVDTVYNVQCRPTSSTASNGATTTYTYSGGRVDTVVGGDGVETDYTYDSLGRTETVKKIGVSASGIHAAQANVTTTYAYDGADHVLSQTLSATGTTETIVSSCTYDLAGRKTSETPPQLSPTAFDYNAAARTQTTTAPDWGTVVQTAYLDGRPKQVEGTAAVAQYYTYAIESDGRQKTQVNIGTSSSARLQKSWTDWLGREIKTERPGFSQSSQAAFIEEKFYDGTTGQLTKTTATGYAPTLYVYNTLGQLTRSGLDVDDGGALVLASNDRITDSDTAFGQPYDSAWWLTTTTTTYPVAAAATPVMTSLTRQRLTGFSSGNLSETKSIDVEGNVTTSATAISGKLLTTTTTVPGISNSRTDISYNGLASSSTGYDGLTTKLQYDALGRQWKVTDARSLVMTTAYVTGTARPSTVTDSASAVVSTIGYTSAGRTDWTQDALGHVTRYAYNTRGQVINQWGSGTLPIAYGYDATYGERTGMSTYRGAPAADYVAWPSSLIGTADTTSWTFDTASGQLWKKTDAGSKVVEFDYNARGQMSTRKWARILSGSTHVTTTYAYDSATGELTGQTYNDGTPSVSYTYTRLGQLDGAIDDAGTRDFVYDSSKPWRLQNETLSSDFDSLSFTRRYDPSGLVGRYAGFKLGASPGSSSVLEQDYAYTSAAGRFDSLTSQRASNAVSATFQYSYTTNTPFINGYTSGSNFAVSRMYESTRNVLLSIEGKWSTTSLTKYEFTTDAIGQRKTAKQSGTAFSDYYATGYTSVFNHYSYNARGELESAAMYRGDTAPAVTGAPSAADELPGHRFEYRYDGAGNRTSAGPTGSPEYIDEQYTTNALNQYTAKENNTVHVTGTAAADSKVAVAGTTIVAKKDRVFATELFPPNGTSAAAGTVTVYSAPASADKIKTDTSRTYFIPKAAQTFSYDDDGNLKDDSVWDYAYDAENRLISMQHRSAVIGTGMITSTNARRLEFKYDYLGRRVAKIVKGGWNGSSYPTTLTYAKFIYDGWNLVAEYSGATSTTLGTLVRAYSWGLDLTGDLTASGGVGALVQVYDAGTSKTYLPTYDGNGNVVTMVDASSGSLEAIYEYNPFGELIRQEGAYVSTNPFRFSTKYTDTETGLAYYGHRYYSPSLGRFINRDPIEESGGVNLYGFCGNNAVNRFDYLGHDAIPWAAGDNGYLNYASNRGWTPNEDGSWSDSQGGHHTFDFLDSNDPYWDTAVSGFNDGAGSVPDQDYLNAQVDADAAATHAAWVQQTRFDDIMQSLANGHAALVTDDNGRRVLVLPDAPNSFGRAEVPLSTSSSFPANSPQEEQRLIERFRGMAFQTPAGRSILSYAEKQGYKYQWVSDKDGGYDPAAKTINLPRSNWEAAPWTMVHEGTHIIDDLKGEYSSDKGWTLFKRGEFRAYSSELVAYGQFKSIPGNENYRSPSTEGLLELFNDQKAFDRFLEDEYKWRWERAVSKSK